MPPEALSRHLNHTADSTASVPEDRCYHSFSGFLHGQEGQKGIFQLPRIQEESAVFPDVLAGHVTQGLPKFDPAMSSSPFDTNMRLPSHHYKTFSSRLQYQLILTAVRKLQESGFYWGAISGKEANSLLGPESAGTFLVRDSSDRRHFFTLSVKTASGPKNLRIQCDGATFFLQSDPKSSQAAPRFDCVLKLVHHYMPPKGSGNLGGPRTAYFIHSGSEKVPLELLRPLSTNLSSLQHLCRKTVNGHLDISSKRDQLPHPLKEFLQEYDAPI
ncbi:suppressor of cytokine signaling 3-like [Arapaima gigas]